MPAIQIISILISGLLLFFILWLIRNKRLKEEYSLLWLLFSVVFLLFSIWRNGLEVFAKFVGIAYPPAALFLILLLAVFLILIQFSLVISRLTERNKTLAQEVAMMKERLSRLEKKKEK